MLLRLPSLLNLLLSLLLGLLLAGLARADLPSLDLRLSDNLQSHAVSQLQVLEDRHSTFNVRTIRPLLAQQGQLLSGGAALGYSDSSWWVGFRLYGSPGTRYYLQLDNLFIDELEVWVYAKDMLTLHRATGDLRPFVLRETPFPGFMLALPTSGRQPMEVILRLRSSSSVNLPLQLIPATLKDQTLAERWAFNALIVGGLLIMALFHLFKYAALRQPQLGYYCALVLCLALYQASIGGLTTLLFWSRQPLIPPIETNLSGSLALVFSCLFIASSLNLQQCALRWLRNGLFLALLLVQAWLISDLENSRPPQVVNLLFLGIGLYQVGLTILGLRLGRPFAAWFALFWTAAILLMILLPLSRAGVIPRSDVLDTLHASLPLINVLLFGMLNGKQLDQLRQALIASQEQAIVNLQRYQNLFGSAAEGIFRCTREGRLLENNPSFRRLCGVPEYQVGLLVNSGLPQLIGPLHWQQLQAQLDNSSTASGECPLRGLDGLQHWVLLSLHQHPGEDSIEGILVDLSERRALEQRLESLAAHDSLTGLLNRREVERLLEDCLNGRGQRFSHLLYLDLDQFKQVNDLCGHNAGDQLLRQLALYLQKRLPSQAILARVGGDEFITLLREADDGAAWAVAEQIRQSVEQFVFTWEARPFRLYVSIGLLRLDEGVKDWQTALNWADSAGQQAKQQGRNRIHRFNPADGALLEHQRQLQWITRLREAIELHHFELFFQSVLPLQEGEPGLHYEVLLRYRDPHSGDWIPPGQFLSAAERYGFLTAIDRWVLRQVCQWLAGNPQHLARLTLININLSAHSLVDVEFHQLVDELLRSHQLPTDKLCFEVTEMVALGELGSSAAWISQLRGLGLKVALDDFGSGFASYAYLRRLPLDLLKIDGSFISGIERDPINQAMVGSMVQIARQLGLRTVAEFVESQAALDCLRELGIDYAQGYFIDRPQPLSSLADATLASATNNNGA